MTGLAEAARRRSLAILAGAGISIPSGIPGAKDLRDSILSSVFPDEIPAAVRSLPLEILVAHLGRVLQNDLLPVFTSGTPSHYHHAIATLLSAGALRYVATTNFDELIEAALAGRPGTTIIDQELAGSSIPGVLHLHGRVSDRNSIVVAVEDVVRNQSGPELRSRLRELFFPEAPGPILVLGYSFSDEFDINPALRDLGTSPCEIVALAHTDREAGMTLIDLDEVLHEEMQGRLNGCAIRCDAGHFLSGLLRKLSLQNEVNEGNLSHQSSALAALDPVQRRILDSRPFYKAVLRISLYESAWWHGNWNAPDFSSFYSFPGVRLSTLLKSARSVEDLLLTFYLAADALARRIGILQFALISGIDSAEEAKAVNQELAKLRGRRLLYASQTMEMLARMESVSPLLRVQCGTLYASSLVEVGRNQEAITLIEDLLSRYRGVVPDVSVARLSGFAGNFYRVAGNQEKALTHLSEADRIFTETHHEDESLAIMPAMREILLKLGMKTEAERVKIRYLAIMKANIPIFAERTGTEAEISFPSDGRRSTYPISIERMPDVEFGP